MKKIDLGQTVNTLANLGVILGIAFLAVELGQNNYQLESQTRTELYQIQAAIRTDFINNVGGLADLERKARDGADLTPVEDGRLIVYRAHVFDTFEFIYRKDYEWAVESASWMTFPFGLAGTIEWWRDTGRQERDPGFVQFIDERVLQPYLESQ